MRIAIGLFAVALIGLGVSIAADPESRSNGRAHSLVELRCRTVGEEELIEDNLRSNQARSRF